jgi:hypothetical protein
MADRLTAAELDKMNKSVSDMTDLSKNLRSEFTKIRNTTNLLSQDFKDIIDAAKQEVNIAQKYLVAQKLGQTLNEKINELKSKSGYLDSISLKFKKDELDLQKRITTAQISRLLSSTALDAAAKKEAIDALKLKMILSDVELDVLEKNIGKNNSIVDSLNQQLVVTDGILNNIRITNDELIDTNGLTNTLVSSFNYLFGKSGLIVKDLGKLGEFIKNGTNPALLLAEVLKTGYENFKAFDKAAFAVRSNLGVLPGQARELESLIKTVGYESMQLGATFEDVGKSINAIAVEFNSLVAQDKDLLKTTTALSKQFGISETTTAKFLKTLGGISTNSTASVRSMTGFAQKISQAAGVPLGKIMEDVANASDEVRIYIGSSALSMIKAATAARMMGIDLNKAASSAEKLLQFESSIASELKASALLGQNINFNYARQLAFNKNIIGANQEILKIAKQVNFNQLNPIQQKAFADAAGKTVGELQDMLTQEKNMQIVENSTNKEVRKRLEEYKNLMKLKEEDSKNEVENAEREFLRRANQEKLNQLQNQFNKLISELAVPVMEITNAFLEVANVAFPLIVKGLAPILNFVKILDKFFDIGKQMKSIALAIEISAAAGSKFANVFSKIIGFVTKVGSKLGFLGSFARFLGPIGAVINAFMFINNLVKRFNEFVGKDGIILGGIKAIGMALYDTLIQPFKEVYDWIMDKLGGKSPSEIGLSIVKGLVSVSGLILDALVAPFIKGYNFISKYIPGASELKMPSEVLADMAGDSKKTKDSITATNGESLLAQSIQTGNQQMIAKIDQLINLMANGGIAVNMDGQRVQNALSRANYRSGGFGQSTSLA